MTLKIYITSLILFLLACSLVNGQKSDTLIQTVSPVKSHLPTTNTSGDNYAEDDFSPGMLFFALAGISMVFICIGFGIAIAAVGFLLVFGLISIGILSTSVIVGLNKRSFTKGFKTLLMLSASIGGLGVGIGALYLINRLFDLHLSLNSAVLIGAVSGIIGGVIVGQLFYVILRRLSNYFKQRLNLA